MKIGYYPGCALCTARPTTTSSRYVRAWNHFGTELDELREWICCGATAAHSLNARLAVALPARNLGLARQQGLPGTVCPLSDVLHAAAQGQRGTPLPADAAHDERDRGTGRRRFGTCAESDRGVSEDRLRPDSNARRSAAGRMPARLLLRLPADASAGHRAVRRSGASPLDGDASWRRAGRNRWSGISRPSAAVPA